MLKNYNYMVTILSYPFIMILIYLKLSNLIKGELYLYLIIALLLIFIPSFIMSLYSASEDILNSKKKWRMILLVFLSIFYLPIYFTKYVSKEEKYLGYFLFVIAIPLTIITINASSKKLFTFFNTVYKSDVIQKDTFIYDSTNKLFSINVDVSFRCNDNNIGEYVISCDRLEDDSFIGIYSYDTSYDDEDELVEKLDFHIKQTISYIEEQGYAYEINNSSDIVEISYNNNVILITERNYQFDDKKYSLIIMKEMPKEYSDYFEYQKMIDSISFLNYNERVSS